MPPALFNRRTLYLLLALNLFLNAVALYAKYRPSSSPSAPTLMKRYLTAPLEGDFNELSLYTEHGPEQCENIHVRQNQCLFVQDNCKGMVAGLFNYLEFYYCSVENRFFGFTVMVLWLLTLFSLVGIAASDFFCPNLSTIASSLHMSENMAGVTFLAFGNGSPDLFSTFSALTADSGGLAIGELVGAASFIINVIVGSMAVISPFQVARYPFLRDITFFLGAVLFVVYTVWDGRVTLPESIFLVCYYITYVAVIVSGSWVRAKFISLARPEVPVEESAEDISGSTLEYQYEHEVYDEYSEQRPLLGKTPSTESPRPMTPLNDQYAVSTPVLLLRPLRAGNDGEAVQSGFDNDSGIDEQLANRATNLAVTQSSLMFRKKIQHRRRQSMLGAFEFRDTMHSWKDIIKRSDPFSVTGAWSPTTPHPPYHRRAPSHDGFDTARAYPRHALRTSSYQGTPTSKNYTSFTTSPLRQGQGLPANEENSSCIQGSACRDSQSVVSPPSTSTSSPHTTFEYSTGVGTPPLPRANLFIDTQINEHSSKTERLLAPPLLTPAIPDSPSSLLNYTPAAKPQLVPIHQLMLPTPLPPGNTDNNEITIISTDYFPDVLHTTRIEDEYMNATDADSARTSKRGLVRPLREILFPHLVDWKYKSHTGKIVGLVATPMVFLLSITVPVVDEEPDDDTALAKAVAAVTVASGRTDGSVIRSDNEHDAEEDELGPTEGCGAKWNRLLTVTQFAVAPVFVSLAIDAADPNDSSLLGVGIAAIVGLVLSLLCWCFTTEENIPKWHRQMCFIGFGIAIVWIYFVANEVVGLLQAFGLILGLSEAIIGLTVFAVGNSLGDFVANVTIARMGFPVMAVSACFGGPMLNILLGIGLSTTYITVRTGQDCQLSQLTPTIFMSSFVLLLSLTASLVIVPATGYRLTRRYGYFLICLYAVGMVVNITMEVVNRSRT